MEEYLRRLQSRLGVFASDQSIHVVLGGPEPDVDTVAATLSLALHLHQKEGLSGRLCVPVFCGQQCSAVLPEETAQYLRTVNIHESLLLWRDDVDLSSLHHTGKLSLTLLRDGILDRSEYHALESSILRVVHHDGPQDTGDAGASFAVTTVAREIRQEAAEHVRAALRKTLGEALRLRSNSLWTKHGRQSSELEELRQYLDQISEITAGQVEETELGYLEQLLTAELKEFNDGGVTIGLSSVSTEELFQDWPDFVEGLRSVSRSRNLDALVVLRWSSSDTVQHSHRQVAVYSNSTGFLNQICSELKECTSWSLTGELENWRNLQIYNVLSNTDSSSSDELHLLQDELQRILKDFIIRQSTAITCHLNSRTSSTEGVAGSVEFSQASSGIIDMYGSDNDRAEESSANDVAIARVMTDGEEDTGGAENSAGVELVSPDSGLTTIRSSRSSKDSSVLFSDDSSLGEVTTGGVLNRNPSNFGLLSQTRPVPPQRKKHRPSRNANDNFDLSNFDPLHPQTSSIKKELASVDSGEGQEETEMETSNLSELEKLSLLYFSQKSFDTLEGGQARTEYSESETAESVVPPTVKGWDTPPSSFERINDLPHRESVASCSSEKWDEFGFDTQRASNMTQEYDNDETEREVEDDILRTEKIHKMRKRLEPQLSLVTEQPQSYGAWIPDSELQGQWNPVTLSELQLTPPEEEGAGRFRTELMREKPKQNPQLMLRKKAIPNTLTPESSKEDDEAIQGKKDRQVELLDFWTYSAQKGFLKSDSGTTTSYPESLDMWNMTIRDDSLSPLTTPDNLSENSGSFCGVNHGAVGSTSVESPQEFSDGGMKMWNTTIQEDSSSTVTSPEGPESGKDLSHMGSLETTESPVSHAGKVLVEEKGSEERQGGFVAIDEISEDFESRIVDHNVKIVIETAEDSAHSEESDDDTQIQQEQNLVSEYLENESTPRESSNLWELPAPGMVTSTSEYDNVGAGTWSMTSSPETYGSPAADIEGLSSPFVTVTKPVYEKEDQYHEVPHSSDIVVLEKEELGDQVFLFDGSSRFNPITRIRGSSLESEYDNRSIEESVGTDQSNNSPFFMVDFSSEIPTDTYHLKPGESEEETKLQADQSSQSHVNIKSLDSHVLPITVTHSEDEMTTETQLWPDQENIDHVRATESVSQSPSFQQKKDALKFSPDSLHPGSRDEARSNSDGDSSSGLEMDYIVVSGTVKEAERAWPGRPQPGDKQSKGTRTTMETFSTLVFAATALQSQVQSRHKENLEYIEQDAQNDTVRNTESLVSDADDIEDDVEVELLSHSQTNNTTETFNTDHSTEIVQTQIEEKAQEEKSSLVGRSVSPSLRYPSDNFLKTREEIYVHSQISMEDSDEGGQSPSAPPTCPTSLGTYQEWGGQLGRQDTSETQSPILTNSSVSHSSSLTETPLSETGISAEKGLGLPFSGDLMEEENDEEDQEEEADPEHGTQANWTPHVPKQRERLLPSSDLLSFSEELCLQQTGAQFNQDRMLQKPRVYDDGHLLKSESLVLRRHQDASSQPTNEESACQWTQAHHVTQGQHQYGYNYHHIDQRTENQGIYLTCGAAKPNSQQNSADVYAEFTSEATAVHRDCEQMQGYYDSRAGVEYSFDISKVQYGAESHFGEDSSSVSSHQQCFQYQDKEQYQYEADHAQYQPSYQSDVHAEREDHASYVPEGYVHFLLSRYSQQGDSESGMMTTTVPSGETAEEQDNREDPLSSGDVSAGSSNQRRKLAAPPLNVSLEHSEGSLLSEDPLDTDDDGLDTGDDLDINIDELDTSDEADSLELNRPEGSEEARHGAAAAATDDILPRRQSAEDGRDSRLWRSVVIGEHEHRIDMKSIEPYKRVISHGGYYADQNAIIVFAACFLPDSDCDNYNYVMENLFLYVISTLELMVAEDYMIVYLNGATPRRRMPGFTWMKKCYQMIDRRLKKNLKSFIIVHPSWFIRTVLGITRPFISSKFSSKIKYVHSLQELGEIIPMEYVHIPHSIVKYDQERQRRRLDSDLQNTAAKAERRGNAAV